MKKFVLIGTFTYLLTGTSILTAQVKVSNLPATNTGTNGDFLIKDDAAGIPGSTKKINVGNFITTYSIQTVPTTTCTTQPVADSSKKIVNTAYIYNYADSVFYPYVRNSGSDEYVPIWNSNKSAFVPSNVRSIGNGMTEVLGGLNETYITTAATSTLVVGASTGTVQSASTFSITGNSTISYIASLGTGVFGSRRTLIFSGTPMLTNSASLILITGGNISVQAGDACQFMEIASGVWKMAWYQRATGQSLVSPPAGWSLTGNSGTSPGTNFIGTTDNAGLHFKVNNVASGQLDSATNNTSFGYRSLASSSTGTSATAIGAHSLQNNTSGSYNSAFGDSSQLNTTTGTYNYSFGHSTLNGNTTGSYNIGIGAYTLSKSNLSGNFAIGHQALATYTASTVGNMAAGYQSQMNLINNTSSSAPRANTSFGYQTLLNATTGAADDAFGYAAGSNITTGKNNDLFGYQAGQSITTGNNNVCIGYQSMQGGGSSIVTGSFNIGIGSQTNGGNGTSTFTISASNNVGVGHQALGLLTTGGDNVGIGYQAITRVTSGSNNTGVGYATLSLLTTASYNTALGYGALNLATGYGNTATGSLSQLHTTTGYSNTSAGDSSLFSLTTGKHNVAVGWASGLLLTTGSKNLFLGDSTVAGATGLVNVTAIGYGAQTTVNNSLVLGGTGVNAVNVGIGTTAPTAKLQVIGAGSTATSTAVSIQNSSSGNILTITNDSTATFTGKVLVPTKPVSDSSTKVANTAFVHRAIDSLAHGGGSYGLWAIYNTSGTPSFYSTFAVAMTAASSGQTINLMGNVTYTASTTYTLTTGVNINLNGNTITFANTSATCITDNNSAVVCSFTNGIIVANSATNYIFYENSTSSNIDCTGLIIKSTSSSSYGLISYGIIRNIKVLGCQYTLYVGAGEVSNSYFDGQTTGQCFIYGRGINNIYKTSTSAGGSGALVVESGGYAEGGYATSTVNGFGVIVNNGGIVNNITAHSTATNVYGFYSISGTWNNCISDNGMYSGNNSIFNNCISDAGPSSNYFAGAIEWNGGTLSNNAGIAVNTTASANAIISNATITGYGTNGTIYDAAGNNTFNNCAITNLDNNSSAPAYNLVNLSGIPIIVDCSLSVTNASANCIYASGSANVQFAANTYNISTTPVNSNITQYINSGNTTDSHGNSLINH